MLRRHGRDTDIDLGSSDPRPRRAILRQPAFGDVQAGENLDTRDDGLRRRIGWRGHRAEHPVDPHPHHEPGPERLNVDIARPQFHGALEQIVDGPHDRRTARQIAQTIDIIIARPMLRFIDVHGAGAAFIELPLQNGRDVIERRYGDFDGAAAYDLDRTDRGGIRRIRYRQAKTTLLRAERKHGRLAQKSRGKLLDGTGRIHQILKIQAPQTPEASHFISELAGRQIRLLPQQSATHLQNPHQRNLGPAFSFWPRPTPD